MSLLSVDAFRNSVANFIVNVYEKFSEICPEEDNSAPTTIEEIYEITYDLSEYTVDYESYSDYDISISYIQDDIVIDFMQCTKDKYNENINTEGAYISMVSIGEYEAMYFRSNHNYDHLIWDNGDYIIHLSSNIGKDELITIAKTVKK